MIEHLFDEALVNAVRRGRAHDVLGGRRARPDDRPRSAWASRSATPPTSSALIATHEAGHATVAWLVAPHRRLEVLTIIKRRDALGLLAHGDREDVYTRSRAELTALIQIAIGGQVAEELFFGDVSTGPGGDLLYATNVAAADGRLVRHERHAGVLRRDAELRLLRHQHRRPGARRRARAARWSRTCCSSRRSWSVACSTQQPAPGRRAARRPVGPARADRPRDHRRARGRGRGRSGSRIDDRRGPDLTFAAVVRRPPDA